MKYAALSFLLLATPAAAQVSALPAGQFMASPSAAPGFLSPRALTWTDLPAISVLPAATTPIAATELVRVTQGGVDKKISISDLVSKQASPFTFTKTATTAFDVSVDYIYHNATSFAGYSINFATNTTAETPTLNNKGTIGIYAEMIDNIGGGVSTDEYTEAFHADAFSGIGSGSFGKAEGFVSFYGDKLGATHRQMIGFEGLSSNLSATATTPPNFTSTVTSTGQLQVGYLSSTGPSTNPIDAHFVINPYSNNGKAQAGFMAAGNGLIYCGFCDVATTATYGVAILGAYGTSPIYINTTAPGVRLDKKASGQSAAITSLTAGSVRWVLEIGNTGAESGSNSGSDFSLSRFSDAGSFIDTPFSVIRSSGQLQVNSIRSFGGVRTPVTTVGALPACAGIEGMRYGVSDALAPTALATVVGGGTAHVSVYCNGTNWIVQ